MDTSTSSSKIKMIKLPPIQLNLSPKTRNSHFSYCKPMHRYIKTNLISDHSRSLNSSTSCKPKNVYNYNIKGMYPFSSEDKMEFKSKAESYVNTLLQENDNDDQLSSFGQIMKTDNYNQLIDPLEIIKEKHVTSHYIEQLKTEANPNKKKDFKEIVSNFSINSNAYRKVAPHGISPKKDELGVLLEEFQRSRQSLKKFCFSREPLKLINNRRKILNPDNSNYEETMFYIQKIFKPDFELRMQKSLNMAKDHLKEMIVRQEETNKQRDLINQVG